MSDFKNENDLCSHANDTLAQHIGKVKKVQDPVYIWDVYFTLPNADNPIRVTGHGPFSEVYFPIEELCSSNRRKTSLVKPL